MRIFEERPSLRAFTLVGWMRDERGGMVVILRNGGQRYLFKGGRLTEGAYESTKSVSGITGSIQGEDLVLKDRDQGTYAISMVPPGQRGFLP